LFLGKAQRCKGAKISAEKDFSLNKGPDISEYDRVAINQKSKFINPKFTRG